MDNAISELERYSRETRLPLGNWMGFMILFLICLHNQVDRVYIVGFDVPVVCLLRVSVFAEEVVYI